MPTEISLQAKLKSNDAYSYADANYHCGLSLTEVSNPNGGIPGYTVEDQNYPDNRKIQSVVEFQINDPVIYNNDPSKWGESTTIAKAPKLQSISIENLGTVDLQDVTLTAEYKYLTFPLSENTGTLNNTALTATTATFEPAAPLPWPFWIDFKINVNQMNINETIKLRVTGITLQNNDQDRTYSVSVPVEDYNNRIMVKCEKV